MATNPLLIQTLREVGGNHPDMVTWWENAVNEIADLGMGDKTVSEIKDAFDAIKKHPTADVDDAEYPHKE